MSSFNRAVVSGFIKYADFNGRARRSEFWCWLLFAFLVNFCLWALDIAMFPASNWSPLGMAFVLFAILPSMAVSARRLHDIGRSAWWLLLWLVPLIGPIVLLVWASFEGTRHDNRFGPDPLAHGWHSRAG